MNQTDSESTRIPSPPTFKSEFRKFYKFDVNSPRIEVNGQGRTSHHRFAVEPYDGIKYESDGSYLTHYKNGEVVEKEELAHISQYPDAENNILKKVSKLLADKLEILDDRLQSNLEVYEKNKNAFREYSSISGYLEQAKKTGTPLPKAELVFLIHAITLLEMVKELSLEHPWVTPVFASMFRTNGVTGFVRIFTGHNHVIRGFVYDKSNDFLVRTSALRSAHNNLQAFTAIDGGDTEIKKRASGCPFHRAGRAGVDQLEKFFAKNPLTNEEVKEIPDEVEMLFFRDQAKLLGTLLMYHSSLEKISLEKAEELHEMYMETTAHTVFQNRSFKAQLRDLFSPPTKRAAERNFLQTVIK